MADLTRLIAAGAVIAAGSAAAAGCPGLAVLVSIPAMRAGLETVSAVANEIFGSSLYERLSRNDGGNALANHDLRRLVRDALSETLLNVAQQCARFSSDRRRLTKLSKRIHRKWGQLTNQDTLFGALDEKRVVHWFAFGAASSAQEAPILQSDEDWRRLVDDLCIQILDYGREPSLPARIAIAEAMRTAFFDNLRRIAKQDFQRGGRGYAALALDFMRLLMTSIGEIREQLSSQGALTAKVLEDLRAARDGIASNTVRCWTGLEPETRKQLQDVRDEIEGLATRLEPQLASIEGTVQRIERTGENTLERVTAIEHHVREFSALHAGHRERRHPFYVPIESIGTTLKGRDEDLSCLHALLSSVDSDLTPACVIHGLGGVGKTRLAIEYARRHRDAYTAVLYAQADSPEILRTSLASLARPLVLDIPLPSDAPEQQHYDAVLKWLKDNPGWLLVLDSADAPEAVRAVRGLRGELVGGRLLITARFMDWGPGVSRLRLDSLTPTAARDFLLARTEAAREQAHDDLECAGRLATDCFDGLPLMLEQAAATIIFERRSLRDYLAEWERGRLRCMEWYDPNESDYPRAVAVTWETTIRHLSTEATAVLRVASHLAPDPIPIDMIQGVARSGARLVAQQQGVGNAGGGHGAPIAELERYAIARREGDSIVVHRLMQEVVRARIPEGWAAAWVNLAVRQVHAFLPNPRNDSKAWPIWERSRTHVTRLIEHGDRHLRDGSHRSLMADLGSFLQARALYSEAELLMKRAIALSDRASGDKSKEMGSFLNNFVTLLRETGRRSEAEAIMRRSLEIAELVDRPNISVRLSNLVVLLFEMGRVPEAEPFARRALELAEQQGTNHPDVAIRLHNLARILIARSEMVEAEEMIIRAIRIEKENHGPDDYRLGQRLGLYADLLERENRTEAALAHREEALRIFRKSFPSMHPWLLEAEEELRSTKARIGHAVEQA